MEVLNRQIYLSVFNKFFKKVIIYKFLKNNWFILSGFIAGRIFYQKTLLNSGQFKSFYFEYPESQKARYEPLIKGLVASFKG
ncbi:MAG: hypothetical protein RL368_294 [Pseudomonadota bacterium]|jgi:hypothetical protein